jgi:hypothetical protein
VFDIFRRDPKRHRRNLVAVQKEIDVQNVLQTVQMKAPVKNRYSYKLYRTKVLGKL